jgi:predicted O-linked N-acetylglucosamine transferase (SPINDLY family)
MGAGRWQEARDLLATVLAANPADHNALHLLGMLECQKGAMKAGIAHIQAAIAAFPCFPMAFSNLGVQFHRAGRLAESLAAYRQALELQPDNASFHANLANALRDAGQPTEAIAQYRRALELCPEAAEIRVSLARLLDDAGDVEGAISELEAARTQRASLPTIPGRLAMLHRKVGHFDQSLDYFRVFLQMEPKHGPMRSEFIATLLRICAWTEASVEEKKLLDDIATGTTSATPFPLLNWVDEPALHFKTARHHVAANFSPQPALWRRARYNHRRIRIAYLSADFHDHATAHLMASVFEQHDRAAFDVRAISFGPNRDVPMRTRLIRAFERFEDVREITPMAIARSLRRQEIDIAVDLKGFTMDTRFEIFAARPAPIQVSFLGYPSTTGAPYIDYVLADRFVLSHDQQPNYSECIVHLPECYQPNDASRPRFTSALAREAEGLPKNGFVFCCFNNTLKLQPQMFDTWMHILTAVPGSVLWLLGDNPWAKENLQREATARGVNPARLVFAPRVSTAQHLVRYRSADLFLDTLPYNAHTTSAEALWEGLPVLTCSGRSFAGRVAGSLLSTLGLPELITGSLEEYKATAIKFATHPDLLRGMHERLIISRAVSPLFDSQRFTRHLEAAFAQMYDRAQRGEKPHPFDVATT